MSNNQQQKPNYAFALTVVIIVCFLIGFITTMNNSMIDFCRKVFNLTAQQGQYVNTAFYGAYALSIPFAFLMSKIGYKKTLVLGLGIVALGFILNYLGITSVIGTNPGMVYSIFLGSMCCVALGVVMLQLVANPYVMVLGSPEKGAFRMTLSQALNSVATTIAPMFITYFIIRGRDVEQLSGSDVTGPFLGLGLFTVLLCIILFFLKLPEIKEEEQAAVVGEKKEYKSSVFKYPHVYLGALGIFMYMGLEIGIPSMLPFKLEAAGINVNATDYLWLYWGGMMVGRFVGAAILSKFQPRILLASCLVGGAACVGLSYVIPGMAGIYIFLAAGLFHSVMWPLIFNLGLQELGPHTKSASGIINMGVIGAATLTPLMGYVVDKVNVATAIAIMFVFYAYLIWFTFSGSRVGLKK